MNLYLVLALALGITSPTVQPRLTKDAAVSRVVSGCPTLAMRGWPLAVGRWPKKIFPANGERRTANETPLTGASTPRAPAFRC